MDRKKNYSLTIITIIVGFMLAVQFQTVQQPKVRDTRDTWQLREDLAKEKELQSKLIREIRSNETKLAKYETERKVSKEQALRDTLIELKTEAGLTEVTGAGITMFIEPLSEELFIGEARDIYFSADLLKRLLNELNMYGALHVSVGGQRVINTTVIRDINGETKINGRSLNRFPIEIKALTTDLVTAEKLYNRMQVSKALEDFFIDNLKVSINKPEIRTTIPPYEDSIRVRYMELVKPDEGGK
ncbi:DUF881 domain-containing protein [Bacillus sp. 31A1R]|uniref:DUF881 domain-containing protein n=1 Tax=Robertmurraya mangrovi TaxID=3098077 RepID=A0ABU5IU88_9BACI|nr:DUF881 domain-containing protein [Bacillus sp. 31A1R]MDZ5470706.1 DUF881 domain-containing protein [Bacillus sp. 31A1R]